MSFLFLTLLVVLSIFVPSPLKAFPTGAGSCPGNQAAVAGSHLDGASTIVNGTLEDGKVQFYLDNDRLRPGRVYVVWVGEDTELLIRASYGGKGIKGFLARLGYKQASSSASDTKITSNYDFTASLRPIPEDVNNPFADPEATAVKVEEAFCSLGNAGGITHKDNTPKYILKGILQIDEALDDLILDVTVVMENTGDTSEYYYSQYEFKTAERGKNEESPNFVDSYIEQGAPSSSSSSCRSMLLTVAFFAPLFSL